MKILIFTNPLIIIGLKKYIQGRIWILGGKFVVFAERYP